MRHFQGPIQSWCWSYYGSKDQHHIHQEGHRMCSGGGGHTPKGMGTPQHQINTQSQKGPKGNRGNQETQTTTRDKPKPTPKLKPKPKPNEIVNLWH